ncbi:MAG: L-histidine N(alpha)-methyltransferase [Lysobacterales bacterium]
MSSIIAQRRSDTVSESDFVVDAWSGLSGRPKSLPSKYLYDARGSELFEQICDTPEYYLTRTELALMHEWVADMAKALGPDIRLVEFGNGSGLKTRLLLQALEHPVGYIPVEISASALTGSCAELQRDFPALEILPLQADFTVPLKLPTTRRTPRRTVLYLAGSTLGNFPEPEAVVLLQQMRRAAGVDGAVLLGLDLKKDQALIHAAYNDAAGITAAFTLNLLTRMNRELDADFQIDQFLHRARYQSIVGRIETDIVSRRAQRVRVAGRVFDFAVDEPVRVEVSCKYDHSDMQRMARQAGLHLQQIWTDRQERFAVVLMSAGGG